MKLSVIVPVYNEAKGVAESLGALQPLRQAGHEVIVVDGGSEDRTPEIAAPLADRVEVARRGRSRQMNEGARRANGEVLLFLHADTLLPDGADRVIQEAISRSGKPWGRFDLRLSGDHPVLRIIERLINWRSRLSGIATGDQAIFVKREVFESIGGYPEIDLMEDIALSKRLKKWSRPICLRTKVITSSRRWEEKGYLRTVLLMWSLRLAYFLGVDPDRLVRFYYPDLRGSSWSDAKPSAR
ncbi:MAG: TIGR04283 family arsenosugar biosynthesis glycosyltransferase [Desulfobacterota bacterium]|nr:TIGR04283 family arsenosugar biosynthesis glycosyltransferase [Thermodesulfobacteriota bacterium]